ncbi:MAG: RnfABCDGE type electron transport complex subunit D [Leptospiraceae bacterium]|nr:RnfABCDGE type electron transport complex subunit D [Leptospiraceae bacterium]
MTSDASQYVDAAVIRTSPHFKSGMSTPVIMFHVVLALLPIIAFAVYNFGLSVLLLISVATLAAVLTESVYNIVTRRPNSLKDNTALITGILLALTLPPGFPLWMAALGGIVAILLGKLVFGGIGYNLFNPALVGRAFLQASFPVAITTWQAPLAADRFSRLYNSTLAWPFMKPQWDAVSGATPLAAFKWEGHLFGADQLFFGTISGSTGETAAVLILLGGLYLALRDMLDWRIPASYLGTVAVLAFIFNRLNPEVYAGPLFMLGSGGLMLGAVFMATDMVSSPVTRLGVVIFGVVIGILTWTIRVFGGLPEGVMYAILIGNALTPLINQFTKHRVYGT